MRADSLNFRVIEAFRRSGLAEQILAEAQGFEPWIPCGMPVFKTGAIDHSAKLPARRWRLSTGSCKERPRVCSSANDSTAATLPT